MEESDINESKASLSLNGLFELNSCFNANINAIKWIWMHELDLYSYN